MSSIQLRPYQTQAIADTRAILAKHNSLVIVLPTGAGKTTVAAEMIRLMVAAGKRVWFGAHLFELVDQARKRFEAFGLAGRVGTIAPNWYYHADRPVQVAMVQTLARRMEKLPTNQHPHFLFIDESHHSPAGSYQKVFAALPGTKRIGLTATPFRLDGKGLGDDYEQLIAPVNAAELVRQGYLVPARYYGSEADLDGIKSRAGDYATDELYKRFNKRDLYAGTVRNYRNFADGLKAIVFCVNVEHSLLTVQAFLADGIRAAHLDGTTQAALRAKILADFAAGQYDVLSNVALFTEGFDLPDLGCVILNRATQSKALYLQMVGRGLRPSEGKTECIVIDQGSNVRAHGFFDDEISYELNPEKKKKKKSDTLDTCPMKECPSCRLYNKAQARTCEECGYEWPASFAKAKETEMVEIRREEIRVGGLIVGHREIKPGDKKTAMPEHLQGRSLTSLSEQELRAVARLRGYHPRWVNRQLELKEKYAGEEAQAA
jgi:superfamily II DNA or RNA helicase